MQKSFDIISSVYQILKQLSLKNLKVEKNYIY